MCRIWKLKLFELAFQSSTIIPFGALWTEKSHKIPSTSQSSISVFDNRVALLYFEFFTMKMTKLDFDVCMPNVDLSLSFKMVKNHFNLIIVAQDIAEIPQGVKAIKLFFCSWLHFLSCTSCLLLNYLKSSIFIQICSQFTTFDDWIIQPTKIWSFHH